LELAGPKSQATCCSRGSHAIAAGSDGGEKQQRIDPDLEIFEPIWSDEVVRGLLDDWMVPAIVDHIIAKLLHSGEDAVT
jgi:hypothetical protein